jgi:hypothetical protein
LCSTVVGSAVGRSTASVGMPSFVAGQGGRIHPVGYTLVDYSLQSCQPPGTTAAVGCCRCRGSPVVGHGFGEDAVGGGERRHAAAVGEGEGVET